ncbi:hypothetical protein RFI_04350, partial [Reticulomyxa filosa]
KNEKLNIPYQRKTSVANEKKKTKAKHSFDIKNAFYWLDMKIINKQGARKLHSVFTNTLAGNKAKKINLLVLYKYQFLLFNDKILICGGLKTNSCYVKERQYKYICNYSSKITLRGHTVIDCGSVMSSKKGKDETILLSFGGAPGWYHTKLIYYKNVWKKRVSSRLSLDESARIKQNKWLSLPQGIVFGKQKGDDLEGARALISGVSRPLLFLAHYPNEIDVIDLKTFRYVVPVKSNTLPFSSKNFIRNPCFVLLECNQLKIIMLSLI